MKEESIKVIRKGKVKVVKSIHTGDIHSGNCLHCGSKCILTRLSNGHDKHEPLTSQLTCKELLER